MNILENAIAPASARRVPGPLTPWFAIGLAACAVPAAQAAVLTVGTPVGPGQCTHATIQAAVTAAAASPGLDIIRVTRGTYLAQRLTIDDPGDLAIEGGFLECATLVRVDESILDGSGANPPGPVIRHLGAGNLTLADLRIRNGAAFGAGSTTTSGGGISSVGTGGLTVYRSTIQNNRARNGGGLFAYAGTGLAKEVTLAGVAFAGNEAVESGGGLYASRTRVHITGDDTNSFSGNRALGQEIQHGGGAIHAVDSNLFIDGRLPTNFPFMDNNWTQSNGGAIYFAGLTPGWYAFHLRNRAGTTPLVFAYNSAARFGGAIYVRATAAGGGTQAVGNLVNVIATDNQAPEGSAFYVYGSGIGSTGSASLALTSSEPGWSAPPCTAQQRCNRVERNVGGQGAPVVLEEGGTHGQASFQLLRGHLVGNVAVNGGGLIYGSGDVEIDNSVLANNDAGNSPLIDIGGGNLVRVQNSTIAGNIRIAPAVFKLASANDDLVLHNSIAFQPGVPVLQAATGAGANLRNLLADASHGIPNPAGRNIQHTLDPLFVNAGQGDFRPRLGSPAVNRWSPGSGVNVPAIDLLGATRPAPSTDWPTPYDFGAYEYGAIVDPVFSDSFDNT